jgi:hypothetical protein
MPTNAEELNGAAGSNPDAWLANVYRSLLSYLDQLEHDEIHRAGAELSRRRVAARLRNLEESAAAEELRWPEDLAISHRWTPRSTVLLVGPWPSSRN